MGPTTWLPTGTCSADRPGPCHACSRADCRDPCGQAIEPRADLIPEGHCPDQHQNCDRGHEKSVLHNVLPCFMSRTRHQESDAVAVSPPHDSSCSLTSEPTPGGAVPLNPAQSVSA